MTYVLMATLHIEFIEVVYLFNHATVSVYTCLILRRRVLNVRSKTCFLTSSMCLTPGTRSAFKCTECMLKCAENSWISVIAYNSKMQHM